MPALWMAVVAGHRGNAWYAEMNDKPVAPESVETCLAKAFGESLTSARAGG